MPSGRRAPSVVAMGRTIVTGFDGSETASRALRYAADRVGDEGKLYVVCATNPVPDWAGTPNYQQMLDTARVRGEELCREAAAEIPAGTAFESEMLEGPAADAILRVAQTRDADEIVVGSRGFGAVRGALGSVSHQLISLADRPLVIVPPANGHA